VAAIAATVADHAPQRSLEDQRPEPWPNGTMYHVWQQSVQVDQALCLRDGLFVERRDPRGERLDELIEFGVGQSPG
jgi:hypothetical protein